MEEDKRPDTDLGKLEPDDSPLPSDLKKMSQDPSLEHKTPRTAEALRNLGAGQPYPGQQK